MNLKEAFKALETAVKQQFKKLEFAQITTIDGATLEYEGDLAEGSVVMVLTEEGSIAAPDGEHELTDGRVVVTEGGVVKEIKEKTTETETETTEETMREQKFMEVAAADGSLLNIEPAVEVGASVMVMTPEGQIAASDGSIELASGQVIEVVDGKIESITSVEGMKKREAGVQAKIEVQRTEVERRFAAQTKSIEEKFEAQAKLIESMANVLGRVVEVLDEKPAATESETRKEAFSQPVKPEVKPLITEDTIREFQKRNGKK
jgi:hypothetical protein